MSDRRLGPDAVAEVEHERPRPKRLEDAPRCLLERRPAHHQEQRVEIALEGHLGLNRARPVERHGRIEGQSLDAGELRQLGRRHSPDDVADTVAQARLAGIDNVSLDLLYDVPGQTLASWRTSLAATLALDPEFMLLDEPTQGMAHEDVGRVVALIEKVSANRTVLMVEHNLSVVQNLCDTITVMQRGSILAEGGYEELARNPEVREAYMGSADD